MKRFFLTTFLILTLVFMLPIQAMAANSWDGKELDPVTRITGSDRYTTNIMASKKWMGNGEGLKNSVVIVNGNSYSDSVISVSLAHYKNTRGSSVLLHDPLRSTLSTEVKSEIKRLLGTNPSAKVYFIGGFSSSLLSEVQAMGYITEKIAGSDRYETAYLVSKKLPTPTGGTAIVVNGMDFADAIGVLGYAGNNDMPILLTSQGSLSTWAEKAIKENTNITNVIILGGSAVVSSTVESQIRNLGKSVTRYAGSDRYETNNLFNKGVFTGIDENTLIFSTTGEDFIDAISAGFNAARVGRPIVLTANAYMPSSQYNYIKNMSKQTQQLQYLYLIGGGVSADTKNQLFQAGWWWSPWATMHVQDITAGSQLKITSYMDFYNSIPAKAGATNTDDVDYENQFFMPNDQNFAFVDSYTNLPNAHRFIDVMHDVPTEHDWAMVSYNPENIILSPNQQYYVQYIVKRNDSTKPIPYAADAKVYNESQLKIYGGPDDSATFLIDNSPAWRYIDSQNIYK